MKKRLGIKFITLLGAGVLLAGCSPGDSTSSEAPNHSSGASSSVAPMTALSVSGRNLVSAGSQSVLRLRGVTFTGGVWFYDAANPGAAALPAVEFMQDEDDIRRAASWGANVINFYMSWYWFDGPSSNLGWNLVERMASGCAKYRCYLLPSVTVYPDGGLRGATGYFGNAVAQQKMRTFWGDFARRYSNDSRFAGFDVLNEPNQAGLTPESITNHQLELVDAVRSADPSRIVFIEPWYGDEDNLIWLPRSNLVYNVHFYKPFYYTSQAMPWMAQGAIPTNQNYPGVSVSNISILSQVYQPVMPAGTYGWTEFRVTNGVPASSDIVYIKLFLNSDSGATVRFDRIRFSTNGGQDFSQSGNGSFEIKNPVSSLPLYWQTWQAAQGSAVRLTNGGYDGSSCMELSGMTAWGHVASWDDWLGTEGGIPVLPGQELQISFMASASNLAASKGGIEVFFCRRNTFMLDKAWLSNRCANGFAAFSAGHNVPIFVGEFSPSLMAKRPDSLLYARDLVGVFESAGASWSFYPYRETWGADRYMGIFNGPYGTPTSGCYEDTDFRDFLVAALSNR